MFASASTRIPLYLSLTDKTSKLDGMIMLVEEVETVPLISIGKTVKCTALDSGFVMNNDSSVPAGRNILFLGKPTTKCFPALDEVSSRINGQFKN